jgi:thiamine-phosphate pyrophosphorylase
MKLIVITPSGDHENETEIITRLFESGLETLHLRKPRLSTKKLTEYIERIPAVYHNRIVIHSHHKLLLKFKLKGVHLTKTHRNRRFKTWFMTRLIKSRYPAATISVSHRRLIGLFEDEQVHDYVFLSPVFDSLTGKYQSGFTEHSLKSAITKVHHKVIARGGVDANVIEKVNGIGFEGVALYSALWKRKDPVAEFNKVVEKCLELGIKIE